MDSLLQIARKSYHKRLLDEGVLSIDQNGIPSNADSHSRLSIILARGIAERLLLGWSEIEKEDFHTLS